MMKNFRMPISSAKRFFNLLLSVILFLLGACSHAQVKDADTGTAPKESQETTETAVIEDKENLMKDMLNLYIDDQPVTVSWEDNSSVTALRELAAQQDIVIDMSMYGGFEQVGPIGQRLPDEDTSMTTQAGDIVLYSGNQIVVFYGSNSWEYTKLGHMNALTRQQLQSLLGDHNVSLRISVK